MFNLRVPLVMFVFFLGGVSSGWMALGSDYLSYATIIYITIPDDIIEGESFIEFFSYGSDDLVNYMRTDEGASIVEDKERADVGVGRPPTVERVEDTCRGGRLT